MKLDIVSKLGFIFMFELIVFQSVCVKHYLSLSQWSLNLEDLTELPVQSLDLVVTRA